MHFLRLATFLAPMCSQIHDDLNATCSDGNEAKNASKNFLEIWSSSVLLHFGSQCNAHQLCNSPRRELQRKSLRKENNVLPLFSEIQVSRPPRPIRPAGAAHVELIFPRRDRFHVLLPGSNPGIFRNDSTDSKVHSRAQTPFALFVLPLRKKKKGE